MLLSKKILVSLRQSKCIPKGSTVLLGVSGGVDSLVLLHIIHAIRDDLGIRICVAHFNHRLRKTSARDETLVVQYAKQLNVPIFVEKRHQDLKVKKVSEDQARQWRFKFFSKAMKKVKADALMLGHHQNDLAETVLMRLMRGSGLYGMRGILKTNQIDGMMVIRPLLDVTRNDIEQYAKKHGIHFGYDETNDQDLYLRNKVRRNLIPLLQREYNPKIVSAVAQLAQMSYDDYAFLTNETQQRLKEYIVIQSRIVKIKQSFFSDNPPAIVRLGLRSVYEQITGDLNQITFTHIELVKDLALQGTVGSVVDWPNGINVYLHEKHLEFRR